MLEYDVEGIIKRIMIREEVMKANEVAEILGVDPSALSKWKKAKKPSMEAINRYCGERNIPVDDILYGAKELINDVPQITVDPFISDFDDSYVKLTAYEIAGAGNEMANTSYEPVGDVVVPKSIYKPHYVPFYVEGDSMEKMIMNHSFVLVDQSPQKKLRDKNVYCFRIPYSGFILRLIHTEPDALFLEPINKQYKIRKLSWSTFEPDWVIGRVICSIVNVYPS